MDSTEKAIEQGYRVTPAGHIRDAGKFEGESVDALYWYYLALDGDGQPLGDPEAEILEGEYFEIEDEDRALCAHADTFKYAILWYSNDGFVSLDYTDKCPE